MSCALLLSALAAAAANVAPTVTIQSAAMRPGTSLMDVVYRVTDPDDATVKVRALAFKDGVRSFANVIRPVTWAEGTNANLGDAITTNVDHTLTWDVAADWNIQLGQAKMEVLAVDSNGIIPFQGITIPAAAGKPELKINQIGLTDAQVFNALHWFYASGNAYMEIVSGALQGSATSGIFKQKPIVVGATLNQTNAQLFLFKLLGISYADFDILTYANAATRMQLSKSFYLTTNWPYAATQFAVGWGSYNKGLTDAPAQTSEIAAISAAYDMTVALKKDGTLIMWGLYPAGCPAGLSGITAIATPVPTNNFWSCVLALKNDGTVVAWGDNTDGKATVPVGLSGVVAIAGGHNHSVALKNDGTVVVWGTNGSGQKNIPSGLTGVTAIAAGGTCTLALKNDGTVVAWGSGATSVPTGLAGVSAIAAGHTHALALKNDGTVVAWGDGSGGKTAIPAGLSGVKAIAASRDFSIALKTDGTVVGWPSSHSTVDAIPAGLSYVTAISAGWGHCFAISKAP